MVSYRSATRIILFIIVVVLFLAVIHRFLVPVLLGLLISLVFRPVYDRVCNKLHGKCHASALLSTLVVLSCVLLPLILVGIFVVRDAMSLVEAFDQMSGKDGKTDNASVLSIPAMSNLYHAVNRVHRVTEEQFATFARSTAQNLGLAIGNNIKSVIAGIPRKIVSVVFFLISFYFGLLDGPRLVRFLRTDLPYSSRETNELFSTVQTICKAVLLGTLAAGCVQGTIIGLLYWVLGIPRPGLFAVLTVIFSFVPLVGSAPTGVGGAIYLLAAGRPVASLIMFLGFVVAALSDNVVKPMVLKGKAELHPLLGLISVLGGIGLFGIAGLFLGPVITALTIVLIHLSRPRSNPPEVRPTTVAANANTF